ncbi:hypothetical protein [Heyndrickxia oleronia]|jgi:hypothetical protein|uniref:hypothetical protein n=1 Tax=Heyndrickxia oleronia TaxID=38875 RepID=UPI00242E0913|nr:hypothetical protein [Heyndrickxia oleronia]MCI1763627.1 hypothetical protein [Heyndrickxia oleronia]
MPLLIKDLPVRKVYICLFPDPKNGQGSSSLTEVITDDEDWVKNEATYSRLCTADELIEYGECGLPFEDMIVETEDGFLKWFEYENCDESDFEYLQVEPIIENGEVLAWKPVY